MEFRELNAEADPHPRAAKIATISFVYYFGIVASSGSPSTVQVRTNCASLLITSISSPSAQRKRLRVNGGSSLLVASSQHACSISITDWRRVR